LVEDRDAVQDWTLQALRHMQAHGDFGVLEPLYRSIKALQPSLGKRWRAYVEAYSFLTYNPNNLKGAALGRASFRDLWRRIKDKPVDVSGAEKQKWYLFQPVVEDTEAIDLDASVGRLMARVQGLIDDGSLAEGASRVSVKKIRAAFDKHLSRLMSREESILSHEAHERNRPTKVTASFGTGRRGTPFVSGGLPSLGKKR
jgi:hypothetical protein